MTDFSRPIAGGKTVVNSTGDAATQGAAVQPNGLLVSRQGNWAVTHAPAANTVASASKAAGGAGVRHVLTGFHAKIVGGTTAPAAIQVTVNVRDGATGAGTILAAFTMVLAAAIAAKDEIAMSDLNIVGSANTAMTVEFSAAGGLNTFECASLQGYSIS